MSWWKICLILFCVFIAFSIIHYKGKNKRPFKRSLISMICGVATLFAVNLAGSFTGVVLPVSFLSLMVSLIGGIPGVTLMLALSLFF
ncbi:MAG: pro-sigmaK processing inhibitor BofA family protein [Ruminococcus sp.]|nr:pro-sigmaK processing inhibitor BofA family protein [Ruminococcus sp.]